MTPSTRAGEAAPQTMFSADFDELHHGDAYTSPPCPIAARDVAVFAALTGDHHPIHVDEEWAAAGPFGKPIAHGMLVLSCAVGVLPLDPERILALRRIRDAVFKRPVAVGDSLIVQCRIAELRAVDDAAGLVDCDWRILGEDERLRAKARVEILWRRAAGGAPAVSEAAVAGLRGSVPDPVAVDDLAPVEVTDDGLRVLI